MPVLPVCFIKVVDLKAGEIYLTEGSALAMIPQINERSMLDIRTRKDSQCDSPQTLTHKF